MEGTVTFFRNVGYLPVERRCEKYIWEILPDDLVGLTENAAAMMYDFFDLKLQGKDKSKSSRNYFDSDDDY